LKWIINHIPHNELKVELTGGEIGLCDNLPLIVSALKNFNNVKHIQGMSNGLVRQNFPELIAEFDTYNEHLVRDIHGKRIEKFYDMNFLYESNAKNVIVSTERTVQSLLDNFEFYKEEGLFSEHFWHKLFVDRTTKFTHKKDLIKLYEKIGTDQSNYYADKLKMPINKELRKFCSKHPWQPCIDLDRNKIIHCGYHQYNNQVEEQITDYNLTRLIKNNLFKSDISYCDSCYLYSDDYKRVFKGNQ